MLLFVASMEPNVHASDMGYCNPLLSPMNEVLM